MEPGLYEQLLTVALERNLHGLADPRLFALAAVDPDDSHNVVAQFLEHSLASGLATFRGEEAAERQKRLVNRIIEALAEELGSDWADRLTISTPLKRLLAIHSAPKDNSLERPDTPLARSALLTGTRLDPSLGSQLRKEIATSDRVDILCSFIRWSGLRVVLDDLRQLAERPTQGGPRLRVITTSYMGATDPRAIEELSKLSNTEIRVTELAGPLAIHAQYIRDEILVALGRWTLAIRPGQREGVLHLPNSKVDAFFVTLQKTEDDYSPTTMYEDYLVSHDVFHWQSQSTTSAESPTGRRYIQHRELGYTPLLFVRETRKLPSGSTAPYHFLGPCNYLSHEGSLPVSVLWKLKHAVPARLFREMARQNVG